MLKKKQRNIEALEKLRSLEVFSMDSLVLIEHLSAMNSILCFEIIASLLYTFHGK
jgi:hypothetical protein